MCLKLCDSVSKGNRLLRKIANSIFLNVRALQKSYGIIDVDFVISFYGFNTSLFWLEK